MSSATSLTEAVKQAASDGPSLTDAVKAAARSGADCTVISFPRHAPDFRPDTVPSVPRLVLAEPPDADALESIPPELSPPPAVDEPVEEMAPPPAPVARRRLRLRAALSGSRPRTRWRLRLRLPRPRGPLPGSAALRALAISAKLAGLKLAGILAISCLSLVATPSPVGPDRPFAAVLKKRVALVIGNSAYRYTRKLENPTNDAVDVGAALKHLGFEVIEGFDLDKAGVDAKIRAFTTLLRGASVGVFFYAGHGLHFAGQNYLVPVDARLSGASAPDIELVRLDLVHRTMEREVPTNILFFDACRDNPLSDSLARAMGTRSTEVGRGLAMVQGGAGTLISFSTQPGTLALDGKGRNSPYSAALVRQLATSHDDLASMLITVRSEVMRETNGRQVPWEHSALTGRFYFNPAPEAPAGRASAVADARTRRATATDAPPPAPDARAREAFEAWSAAKDTASVPVLQAFIARYDDTFYAELARARLEELRKLGGASKGSAPLAGLAPTFD